MTLHKRYIRDGKNKLIGSVTSGFSDGTSVVRDAEGNIQGRTSNRFHTTRDSNGRLVSIDAPEPGLLFGDGEE